MNSKAVGLLYFIAFLTFSCNNSGKGKNENKDSLNNNDSLKVKIYERNINDPVRDSILLTCTKHIVTYFKNRNYDSLIKFLDTKKGLLFSPYTFIDTSKYHTITSSDMYQWMDSKKQPKINWGVADASGDPISLTPNEYVKKYVNDVDFLKADSIVTNRFIGSGTMQNNILDIYPDCVFTESFYKGSKKNTENLDWRSLRLIFEKSDGQYYLIAVVHDEWTM